MSDSNDFAMGYAMGQDSNGNCNDGGWGFGGMGGWIWIILLFAVLGGGWGGFGGFGGGWGANGAGLQGIVTRADINEGFMAQDLRAGIRGLEQGLCNGFHDQTVTALQGFNGVERGFADLSRQLGDCCCENRAAIADLKFAAATESCATRNLIQNTTRDLIDNANANTRQIMDFLVQDKISALQAENQSLKFAASQAAQNAFITANQEAQTAELIRRLGRDCPIPAYVVPNPNCCYGNPAGVGYGGCGCGNGFAA